MNKNKKSKILIAFMIFIIGTISSIYLSTLIDQILSKEMGKMTFPSISDCINSLKINQNHLKLFASFELLIVLGSFLLIINNDKPYQSDLIRITPKISTPVSAGQKQFGSARWMTEEEKHNIFPVCVLKKSDKLIGYLLEHGYDDIRMEEVGEEDRSDIVGED